VFDNIIILQWFAKLLIAIVTKTGTESSTAKRTEIELELKLATWNRIVMGLEFKV